MNSEARPPVLVLRLPFEGIPQLVPVCDTYDDELRLARYVDDLLVRRQGLLHQMVASWLLLLEEERAA